MDTACTKAERRNPPAVSARLATVYNKEAQTAMAPKNKFTRDEMVQAALRVVRAGGIHSLTAKALADELGTSTQPVFTCFSTMDTLRGEVRTAAQVMFDSYIDRGLNEPIPFFGVGMQQLRFARTEPQLYRLLFLTGEDNGTLAAMQRMQDAVRPAIMRIYRLDETAANRYFRDLWLVGHSLATLIVTGECPYSEREIAAILTGFSVSVYQAIRRIPGFVENSYDRDAVFRALIGEGEQP